MELKIKYDATHEVWFAYDGPDENNSNAIGQGSSPEAACSDFWYQVKGSAAELSHDEKSGWWKLSQGCHSVLFQSREAAIQYAASTDWQVK